MLHSYNPRMHENHKLKGGLHYSSESKKTVFCGTTLLSSFPTEQTATPQFGLARLPRLSLVREASVHKMSAIAVSTRPKYLLLMIPPFRQDIRYLNGKDRGSEGIRTLPHVL